MKKNELVVAFTSVESSNIFALLGPNNSGKSFFIKNDLYDNPLLQSIMMLDETGEYSIKGNRNEVKIVGDYYYYVDETKRGMSDGRTPSTVKISTSSMNIIKSARAIYDKTNIPNKSLGTIKINQIADSLLKYNLNEIQFFIFDEPENSLDDERMKYLERLFNVLIDNNKKIFFVTHSPRFLELLQIDIDNIYVLPGINKEFIHYKKSDVYELFNRLGNDIIKIIDLNGQISPIDKIDYMPNTLLSRIQIDIFLKSFDFYKVLFYSEVCIIEGDTEEYTLKSLNDKYSSGTTIYNTNGKYHMPFLASLFNIYGIKVKCILDSDIKPNGKNKLSVELTKYLQKLNDNKVCSCVILPGDLEGYLNIEVDSTINRLTGLNMTKNQCDEFKRNHKALIAYSEIISDPLKKKKILNLISGDLKTRPNSQFSNIFEIKGDE